MVNPCCCMSLKKGVSVLAIIDAILNILSLAVTGLALAAVIVIDPNDPKYEGKITKDDKTLAIVGCVLFIISAIFGIALAFYLRNSAKNSYARGCIIWLWITAVILILNVINVSVEVSRGSTEFAINLSASVIGTLYKLYEMWVVYSFVQEVKTTTVFAAVA